MWNMNSVTSIEFKHDYVYRVAFDDGLEGDVDFAEYIGSGPIFEPLRDPAFFRRASIEGDTISWPNGAEVAPETLYEKIEHARQSVAASRSEGRG
jgi:hypothetical protein